MSHLPTTPVKLPTNQPAVPKVATGEAKSVKAAPIATKAPASKAK